MSDEKKHLGRFSTKKKFLLALSLFCCVIAVLLVKNTITHNRDMAELRGNIATFQAEVDARATMIQPGEKDAGFFAEGLRGLLRASTVATDRYAPRGAFFAGQNLNHVEIGKEFSDPLSDICILFREYAEYSADRRLAYAYLAEVVQPVLLESSVEAQPEHQLFLRDLYASCCAGSIVRYTGETEAHQNAWLTDDEVELWYARLLAPMDSKTQDRLIDLLAQCDALITDPFAVGKAYMLHTDDPYSSYHLFSLSDMLERYTESDDGILRYWIMCSEVYSKLDKWPQIHYNPFFPEMVTEDGRAWSLAHWLSDYMALPHDNFEYGKLLGAQFLKESGWERSGNMQNKIDPIMFYDIDVYFTQRNLNLDLANRLYQLLPEPYWNALLLGAPSNWKKGTIIKRNDFLCWNEAALQALAEQGVFIPTDPLRDGYILIDGSDIASEGVSTNAEEIQRRAAATLRKCQYIVNELRGNADYSQSDDQYPDRVGTLATNPNNARVGIVFSITYPRGRVYGWGIQGYNCELTLQVIDLFTKQTIASVTLLSELGTFISANQTHASFPSVRKTIKGEEFLDALRAYYDDFPQINE